MMEVVYICSYYHVYIYSLRRILLSVNKRNGKFEMLYNENGRLHSLPVSYSFPTLHFKNSQEVYFANGFRNVSLTTYICKLRAWQNICELISSFISEVQKCN